MDRTVLLIHPEQSRMKYRISGFIEKECLDAEIAMTVLKQNGFTVWLYDGEIMTHSVQEELSKKHPDFVILYGQLHQEAFMLEYCQLAKKCDPGIVTIIAGEDAQLNYRRLYHDAVDYILTGYDPNALLYVLGEDTGRWQPNGICHKVDGVWSQLPARSYDIQRLPWADRSLFDANPDRYRFYDHVHTAWVRTSFSCTHQCAYCAEPLRNRGEWCRRDARDVVDEIASIQAENIFLCDADFLCDEDYVSEFLRVLQEKDIHRRLFCTGRADFIASHETLVLEMKGTGFAGIVCELQYCNDAMLSAGGKGTTAADHAECIRICKETGIHLYASFLVHPDFRDADFRDLYRYISDNGLLYTAVSVFTPEPGTPLYDAYKDSRITDDSCMYDHFHLTVRPSHMSLRLWYTRYYWLLLKLCRRGKREGICGFADYGTMMRILASALIGQKDPSEIG